MTETREPDVVVTVTPELSEYAAAHGWTAGQILATAMQLSNPDATDVEVHVPPNRGARRELRRGYVGRPVPGWRDLAAQLGYPESLLGGGTDA